MQNGKIYFKAGSMFRFDVFQFIIAEKYNIQIFFTVSLGLPTENCKVFDKVFGR